nr:unnamed protein product [Digitaria exilis]
MTARSDDPGVSPGTSAAAGGEIWGTWEELLLACAVRRHGTDSWDSVAMEVQSRCPAAAASRLTPTGCRLRFRLLHRRFAAGGAEKDGGDEDPDAAAAEEWVEELRKLRVAELRREVERYDLSIGSLQSKVKRLKEERERSISGEANPPSVKAEEDEEEPAEGKGSLEEDAAGGEDRVSGGESGRSCKESNSSDLKRPADDAGVASAAGDGAAAAREEEEEAAARESLDVKREQVSGESVAGSKEADKESSDVQSSASPSRRREREGGGGCGGGGEEAEAEASASPSARAALPAAEAEALLAFLESVRTSKPGSVFERRLESQDDTKYGSLIRRHVDLETIRSKLEAGGNACYGSASEFYRDLLLLCANALVFFPRGSPEHAAAARTRALVSKHMAASLSKDQPGTAGKSAVAPPSKKAKAEADVGSLLEKTAPIIVCRKRSSIAKAAAAASKEEKVDKGETEREEEENEAGKKKKAGVAKDKARGLRTNKTRAAPVKKAAPNQKKGDKGSDSDTPAEGTKKPDKKGGTGAAGSGAAVAKKRNAVNFLNRMKQGSAPSTERVSLLETLKLSAAAEQKKAGKGSEGKKETAGGSGSKRGTPPGRRNVGRPSKRAAAPPSPPPAKRGRGGGGKRGGKK